MTEPEASSILLVDDRDENLFALEQILKPLDARTHRATSGPEALSPGAATRVRGDSHGRADAGDGRLRNPCP